MVSCFRNQHVTRVAGTGARHHVGMVRHLAVAVQQPCDRGDGHGTRLRVRVVRGELILAEISVPVACGVRRARVALGYLTWPGMARCPTRSTGCAGQSIVWTGSAEAGEASSSCLAELRMEYTSFGTPRGLTTQQPLPRYGTETKKWPPPTAAEEAKNYCLQQRRRTTTKNTTAAAQRWRTGKNGPVRGPAGPLGALVQPQPPPPAGAVAAPPSRSRRVLAESRSKSRQKTSFINLPPSHRLSDCFRGAEAQASLLRCG